MKKKKLLLINPANTSRRGFLANEGSKARFQPYGLGIVAALTPAHWEIEILDENFDRFEFKPADLIGLTSYTSNIVRAYEIASVYRARKIPTVIGGIHVSMVPEEAARYVDTVVIGEAESTWAKVINDFDDGKIKQFYHSELLDMKFSPIPRRDLYHPRYKSASIQTTRGCPSNCDFCSVTAFNGKNYRPRPVEHILEELVQTPQKNILFVDDNICGYNETQKQHALDLFKGIVANGIKKNWLSQASLNFADDDEFLEWAARSGCRMILLGIESEKEQQLKEFHKTLNIKRLDSYSKIFRNIHRHGISIVGTFIFGMENDQPRDLISRRNYILRSSVDAIQSTILTPLPGTPVFKKMESEGRIFKNNFPDDWVNYHFIEPVFQPKNMSPETLKNTMEKIWQVLYHPWVLRFKFFRSLWNMRQWNPVKWARRGTNAALYAYHTNWSYRNFALEEVMMKKKDRKKKNG